MSKKSEVFKFGSVAYPINKETGGLVPSEFYFNEEVLDEQMVEGMLASMIIKKPVLLTGVTGIGKTSLVKWLAYKTNNSYRRIQLNGSTGVDNLVGKWLINESGTYWEDGILTDAMREGHFLLLDEINAALPEVLFILNSVLDDDGVLILDDKGKEVVKPHPNFRVFAAMNPSQDYAGTKEMNRAQLDRYSVFELEYPKPNVEIDIIKGYASYDVHLGGNKEDGHNSVISRMVDFANIIRQKNTNSEWVSICSTRQLIQWIQLSDYLSLKYSAEIAILNKCDAEERTQVRDELNKLFRNNESIKKYKKDALKQKALEDRVKALDEKEAVSEPIKDTEESKTISEEVIAKEEVLAEKMLSEEIVEGTGYTYAAGVDIDILKAQRIAAEILGG